MSNLTGDLILILRSAVAVLAVVLLIQQKVNAQTYGAKAFPLLAQNSVATDRKSVV